MTTYQVKSHERIRAVRVSGFLLRVLQLQHVVQHFLQFPPLRHSLQRAYTDARGQATGSTQVRCVVPVEKDEEAIAAGLVHEGEQLLLHCLLWQLQRDRRPRLEEAVHTDMSGCAEKKEIIRLSREEEERRDGYLQASALVCGTGVCSSSALPRRLISSITLSGSVACHGGGRKKSWMRALALLASGAAVTSGSEGSLSVVALQSGLALIVGEEKNAKASANTQSRASRIDAPTAFIAMIASNNFQPNPLTANTNALFLSEQTLS